MFFLVLLLTFLVSGIITFLVIPYIVRWSETHGKSDMPNERKVHTIPISRLGGVCFFPTMILVTAAVIFFVIPFCDVEGSGEKYGLSVIWRMMIITASSFVLFITGIWDDTRGLNYKAKFLAQFLAALIIGWGLCLSIFGFNYHFFLVIFLIVYIINAMNLIDGIDGLASGIGIISLTVLAIVHAVLGNWFGSILAASLCGVLASFFYYNVFSIDNKIFMGDTGSLTIGLVIAYLVISVFVIERKISGEETFYLPTVLGTLLVPMLDVLRVFTNRILNRKNPFKADKTHVHHRLIDRGYTPTQTLNFLLFHTAIVTVLIYFGVILFNYFME